ncbi:hypothetical protein GCM10023085_10320 [Actinomadura viridis]|uniref:DNA invertase Pin-like site-specific DNA recombinase n=1 Tax=Actinomadura viridis TaxID=58110 RepID=A0A931GLH0_9ACTN|nr:recombinase family protein [Actinomadura viridis]MBG6092043.1 DNA invertase Pin-like site-specific DNA recombinase [Actinomadura viridis]
MSGLKAGYARCSTDMQDLTAQKDMLLDLGVIGDRIVVDEGLTGPERERPGLDQALAAVRAGDTLVVPTLDRLARSVPARDNGDSPVARAVALSLVGQPYDPTDPMGKKRPKLTARRRTHLVQQHQSGKDTIADLAELFSVSRATAYRVLERHQAPAVPPTAGGR